MAKLWQQIRKGEKGQALPVVLVLLVVGGLLVTPCLNYASTSLHAGQIVKENVRGIYAADAGVEDALWRLKNDPPPPLSYDLPEPVNQMAVAVETEYLEEYVLYYGGLIEVSGKHYEFLTVNGEMGEWDAEAEAYPYTITVTRQPEAAGEVIHLGEVGVRLPVGYSYQSGSADSFPDNLSDDEPEDTLDGAGAQMLVWGFKGSGPEVSEGEPPRTQTFYVNGEGGLDGDYTWVQAVRQDIGVVGEVIGTLYRITATATRPGDGEITVMADVIVRLYEEEETAEIHIIRWQINPQ